jgi:hypothetical protein
MARRGLPQKQIVDLLEKLTGKVLKRDTTFLARMIVITRRQGELNWDANIGVAPMDVRRAFEIALQTMKQNYSVEWDEQ